MRGAVADPSPSRHLLCRFARSVEVSLVESPHGLVPASTTTDIKQLTKLLGSFPAVDFAPALPLNGTLAAFVADLSREAQLEVLPQDLVTITLPPGLNAREIADKLNAMSFIVHADAAPSVAVSSPVDTFVGKDDQAPPGEELPTHQWYLHRCRVIEAWTMATGQNTTIVVIDSGFHLGHPDLAGAIDMDSAWTLSSFRNGQLPAPRGDHGTPVCGMAGARANGSGMQGVAPDARLVPMDWDPAAGSNGVIVGNRIAWGIVNALGRALETGRRFVVNISAGYGQLPIDHHESVAAATIWAALAGVPVCIAAGNEDVDLDALAAANPRSAPHSAAIVVGATAFHPELNARWTIPGVATESEPALGSNYGTRVAVWAPGDPRSDISCCNPSLSPDGKAHGQFGQTSAATPKVTATIALMLEADPLLSRLDAERILLGAGTPLDETLGGKGTFIDTAAAVKEVIYERLVRDQAELNWRFCIACSGLWRPPGPASCPSGGTHNTDGSGNYAVVVGPCPVIGEGGWPHHADFRQCSRCCCLVRKAPPRSCAGGVDHELKDPTYVVARAGSPSFEQGEWRRCLACGALFFGAPGFASRCFAGSAGHTPAKAFYWLKQR